MTRLEGSQVLLAPQLLHGKVTFSIGPGTSSALGTDDGGNAVGWVPSGGTFFSYSVSRELKLGVGVAGSFGLGEAYHDGWVGRYYAQGATLIGLSFLPAIAYRFSDNFSAGLAVNAMYGVLKERVAINNLGGIPDGQLRFDSTTWGWGLNVGLLYEASPETRFGLTYNSRVKLGFSAPAQFSGLSSGLQAVLDALGLSTSGITARLIVPQQVLLAAFHQIDARWAILGNVGTIISFRIGPADTEALEKEFYPEFRAEDLLNLPNYSIYLKLMVDGVVSRPFSATTIPPFPDPTP